MRYYYGIVAKFINSEGRNVTAKQLASIIKKDVKFGKWNLYTGGAEDSVADISYHNGDFTYHEHLFITGKPKEFQELERLIKPFIEVIPRQNS